MNPEELKWAVLQIQLAELRGHLFRLLGMLDPKQDQDYQKFLQKVKEPCLDCGFQTEPE